MNKFGGGSAFPNRVASADNNGQPLRLSEADESGMSLRDWFAGQALAGYFANPSTPHRNAADCAEYMYEMADQMLKARRR